MGVRRVIIWVAVAMLGGCMEAAPPATPVRTRPAPAPAANPARPPLPVALPKEREKQAIDPQILMGLTEAEMRTLLGDPTTVRPEPPALIWSYASQQCVVDLYFYLELASETYKTVTFEMTPKEPHGLSGGACLASVRNE
jgi:hypothetical protein